MSNIYNWGKYKLKLIISKNNFISNFEITGASKILELDYGHLNSVKTGYAIDTNNNRIPWFTYPAIEYLSQLNFSDKKMLEWGSGNSSIFFGKRVNRIYSVEHNNEWYVKVKEYNIKNQHLVFTNEKDYAMTAYDFKVTFDIILIDGIKRDECGLVALKLLNTSGMIILDNSDRYPDISAKFRSENLIQIDFHGFGPINNYSWTTSIFLNRDFNFKPMDRQPIIPIGGGY